MEETKVTSKFQTTIPQKIRKILNVQAGNEVEWYVVKEMVIVDKARKIDNPVRFLTSQIEIDIDAVKLVKQAREEFR
jgi:AbrB family looped-hinge helix DNA binding protein